MKKALAIVLSLLIAAVPVFAEDADTDVTEETTLSASGSDDEGEYSVSISGDLGDAAEVLIERVTDTEEILSDISAAYGGFSFSDGFSYKVTLVDSEGNEVSPSGEVTVTISGDNISEAGKLVLYESMEEMDASWTEGSVSFSTSSLGIFIVCDYITDLESGEYTLTEDIAGLDWSVAEGKTVILNLNGYDIEGSGEGSVFTVAGSLTVNGSGTVTGGSAELGGAFYVSGSLSLAGVYVTGNSAEQGGGIYAASGSLALDETYVWGNTASVLAADIYVSESTAFSISNVSFENVDLTLGKKAVEGWFDDSEGARWEDAEEKISIASFEENTEYSLIAAYDVFHITYDANSDDAEGSVKDSASYCAGDTAVIAAGTYTLSGYIFESWNTESDGSRETYNTGDEVEMTGNLVLYAQYAEAVTVSYDANSEDAEGTMESETVKKGAGTVIAENLFTLDGYAFDSWNTESDGSGDTYAAGDTVSFEEDVTLYAQWTKEESEDNTDDTGSDTDDTGSDAGSDTESDTDDTESDTDDTEDETDDSEDEADDSESGDDTEDSGDDEDSESENDEDDEDAGSEDDADNDDEDTDSVDDEESDDSDDEEEEEAEEDADDEEAEIFKIYIKSVSDDGGNLKGAEFVLYTEDEEEVLSWESTYYAKGIELTAGNYILIEDEAPEGYEAADDVYIEVLEDGDVYIAGGDASVSSDPTIISVIHMLDTSEKDVVIYKLGMADLQMSGAVLVIYDEDGDFVEKWTTTDSPETVSLAPGDYTLHESSAPDGYFMASDIDFTVNSDGTIEIDGEEVSNVTMSDTWTLVALELFDGSTGLGLEGALLQVLDEDGDVVKEWISDEDGINRLSATLVAGETYTLHEVYAPYGYAVASDITFTVSSTSDEQYVIMKNYPSECSTTSSSGTGVIQITKTVTGSGADYTKKFGFLMYLFNADGTAFTDSFTYIASDGTSGNIAANSAGQVGFELAHGESVTFYGIPEGVVYSVMELDYSASGYTSSVSEGTAVDETGSLSRISFTNTYSASSVSSGSSAAYSSYSSNGSGGSSSGSSAASSSAVGTSVTGTVESADYDTGDSSNMGLWILIGAAGLAAAGAVIWQVRKRRV